MKMKRNLVVATVATVAIFCLVAAKVYADTHPSCDGGAQMSVTKNPTLVICVQEVRLSQHGSAAFSASGK